jgi:hypothetical protein
MREIDISKLLEMLEIDKQTILRPSTSSNPEKHEPKQQP